MSLQQHIPKKYDLSKIESCCSNEPEFLIIYKWDGAADPLKVCKYHYSKDPSFNNEKIIKEKFSI
jgi:hypothetical protein